MINLSVGQQLGNYHIIQHLGQGGFANVYLGEHLHLKTQAAIKVIHTQMSQSDLQDFVKEAQMIAALKHPHIVRILDFGEEKNIPFLVMEHAAQGTLRQRHPKGSVLSITTILSYVKQVATALQYAHDHKLIHQDVKPENMLVEANSEILLSDFGIAVIAHSTSSLKTQRASGTPLYMAPEQWDGKSRPASDQYALGIVVYEWLSGKCPFQGNIHALQHQHKSVAPPPFDKSLQIPSAVEDAVQKALAKDPEQRFARVQDFATALDKANIPPRSIFLFGYEIGGGKQSILWSNPFLFSPDETYQAWSKTKRDFTQEEILHGLWVKVSEYGNSFIVRFLPDGSLTESPLFGLGQHSQGVWQLIDGFIRMNISGNENGTFVQYELDIFANRENTMHSGVELTQDRQTPHAYFKVLHVQSFNKNQWNDKADFELVMSLLKYRYLDAHKYIDEVRNRLGSPTSPEFEAIPSPEGTTGWVQRFAGRLDDPQGASVYRSKYGTYPIWGEIGRCYESLCGTTSRLGFPTSPELEAIPFQQGTIGQVQRFEDNASVYYSGYGAYPTWGGIGQCYEDLGGTSGPLGFPTSPELEAIPSSQGTSGWVQRFEGGDMYWTEEYDGVAVREPILTIFQKSGGSGGKFGFPKSPVVPDAAHSNHYIQEFEGAVIQSFYQSPTQ